MQFPYLDAQESVLEVSRSSLPRKFNAQEKKKSINFKFSRKIKIAQVRIIISDF